MAMKLTRGKLLKDERWVEWQHSEYLQLNQYNKQGMFGVPCYVTKPDATLNLVWTYNIKELDRRKKARYACDGSPQAGQTRVLNFTYANCVDHTSSRLFYAISAGENPMVFAQAVRARL